MLLYRITSKVYARDLSGTGAMLNGGRWNPKGIRMLYTSSSLSLATLEIIVNLSSSLATKNLYCVELELPDELEIDTPNDLPNDWNTFPYSGKTVKIGMDFIKNYRLCLKVPSAIVPNEFNYLLNPEHDDFMKVKFVDARPFILDKRLY